MFSNLIDSIRRQYVSYDGPPTSGAEYNVGPLDKPTECSIPIEDRRHVAHLKRLGDSPGTSDFEFTLCDKQTIRRTIVHSVLKAPEQLLFSNVSSDTGAMELIKDTQWYVSEKSEGVVYELRKVIPASNSEPVPLATVTILEDQGDTGNFYSEIHVLSPQYESDLKMTIILESILVTCAILGIDKDIDFKLMFNKWSQVSIVAGPETDEGLPGSTSTSGAGPNTFEFFWVCVPGLPHMEEPPRLTFLDYLGRALEEFRTSYDGLVFGSTYREMVKIFDLCYQRDPRKLNLNSRPLFAEPNPRSFWWFF